LEFKYGYDIGGVWFLIWLNWWDLKSLEEGKMGPNQPKSNVKPVDFRIIING
jgi:hypothetical protein